MQGLQQLLAFAQTARRGSFAGAARDLGGTPSSLAKSVARLEAALGVKLFHRTTRQVRLTADGERLFERCQRVIAEFEDLRSDAAGTRSEPSGLLRVNMPIFYGRKFVLPLLADLKRRFPLLTLEVHLNDRFCDLVRDCMDLAVRLGELGDSTQVARRIGSQHLMMVASPHYLAQHGTPTRITDLASHEAVAFRLPSTGRNRPWQLRQGRRFVELEPPAGMQVSDTEALGTAAALGLGIAQLPDYIVTDALANGTLVPVLSDLQPPPMPINAVVPSGRLLPARVRVLLDALSSIGEQGDPAASFASRR